MNNWCEPPISCGSKEGELRLAACWGKGQCAWGGLDLVQRRTAAWPALHHVLGIESKLAGILYF